MHHIPPERDALYDYDTLVRKLSERAVNTFEKYSECGRTFLGPDAMKSMGNIYIMGFEWSMERAQSILIWGSFAGQRGLFLLWRSSDCTGFGQDGKINCLG